MTTELWFLFATTILLTILWVPYIVGMVKAGGELTSEFYKTLQGPKEIPNWVKRANRAHQNLVEQFGAYAAIILTAHVAEVATLATSIAAGVFLFARVIHAISMLGGYSKFNIRTKSFMLAMLAILAIGVEVIRTSF